MECSYDKKDEKKEGPATTGLTYKKKISNGSITYGFANKSGPEIEVLGIK